jgi:hypothetical protein
MYRCPTCVSLLVDATVRRCPVCGENFKRRPPTVIGAARRGADKLTSWDIKATSEAGRFLGQEADLTARSKSATKPDIDLPKEHRRDISGRAAGADRG